MALQKFPVDTYVIQCDRIKPKRCYQISPAKNTEEECKKEAAKLGWRASQSGQWYCPKHAY